MVRKKKEPNHIDAILDTLLADCQGPEDILEEAGLLKRVKSFHSYFSTPYLSKESKLPTNERED